MRRLMRYGLRLAVVLALAAGARVRADFTFQTIDVPGASLTQANSINDSGQIVGRSSNGGFLYSGGVFTTIPMANAQDINDSGQIVGFGGGHGFLYSGGVLTAIDVPGATFTDAYGNNNAGQIVGIYNGGHGFLYSGGVFTTIDVPGASGTVPYDINNKGQIVGGLVAFGTGFLYSDGIFTTLPFAATSINDSGQIVGFGSDHGFLYSGGVLTTIDVPGAVPRNTFPYGINNAGLIVGDYRVDGPDNTHGFLATPVPEPSEFVLLVLGLAGVVVVRMRTKP